MEVPQIVREHYEALRLSGQPNTGLEDGLNLLIQDAEWAFGEIEVLDTIVANSLPEAFRTKNDVEDPAAAAERGLDLLAAVGKELRLNERVDLFAADGLAELRVLLSERDSLEVFRERVLGVLRRAGALAMATDMDDNRVVIMLETLMP